MRRAHPSAHSSGDLSQTANYKNVERCRIYWGLDFAPYKDGTQIATLRTDLGGFHPEEPSAQEELLRACDAVHSSPLEVKMRVAGEVSLSFLVASASSSANEPGTAASLPVRAPTRRNESLVGIYAE